MNEILARVRKTDTAELRVTRSVWKGRVSVDFRLWYIPPGQDDYAPSSKGVAIDAGKLPELIAALNKAIDLTG